jgi:hypothetical protein
LAQLALPVNLFILAVMVVMNAGSTVSMAASSSASFVQAAASAAHGTPSTLSLAFPSNTRAGDLLLVAFDFNTSVTMSSLKDSQGNMFTQVGKQLTTPGGIHSQVYYAKNIKGGADTVTVTLSGTTVYLELYLTEYAGINTTNPIDAQAGASGSTAAVSSGNATTTVAGDIIYGYCLSEWTCTAGSGFTARSTLDSNVIEDKVAGSVGSYAATGTDTSTRQANSGWTMQMLALKPASASAPGVSLSSSSLSFGSESVGASSTAQTVTLSNTGSAALSITSIGITGVDSSDFTQTNNCGSSVAAGAKCTISVTFTPAASGSLTAALSLTDNATGSPQSVSLAGTGAASGGGGAPAVSLSSTSLSFGSEPVAMTSAAKAVTLSNTGSAALNITRVAVGGTNPSDFAEIADTCGSSVAAGGNCTIEVTFTPSAADSYTATLSITDNAGSSPQTVSLSGTGAHDVILSWAASGSSGVIGYNIFRGATSRKESTTPLNSSPITGTTYTDSNVTAGQTYYYMITAVSSSDVQSADSGEVSATVP